MSFLGSGFLAQRQAHQKAARFLDHQDLRDAASKQMIACSLDAASRKLTCGNCPRCSWYEPVKSMGHVPITGNSRGTRKIVHSTSERASPGRRLATAIRLPRSFNMSHLSALYLARAAQIAFSTIIPSSPLVLQARGISNTTPEEFLAIEQ